MYSKKIRCILKKNQRIIAKVGLVPTRILEGNLNIQAINIE